MLGQRDMCLATPFDQVLVMGAENFFGKLEFLFLKISVRNFLSSGAMGAEREVTTVGDIF